MSPAEPENADIDDIFDHRMDIDAFAASLGLTRSAIPSRSKDIIEQSDLRFRETNAQERSKIERQIHERLEAPDLPRSGPSRQPEWEKGWAENLEQFRYSGGDVRSLTPKYYTRRRYHRYCGRFVEARSATFEMDWFRAFRRWLFPRYLSGFENIVEFGCGPGHNLVDLAEELPGARLTGCDWASSACQLVDELGRALKIQLESRKFDMFCPDSSFRIPGNSAILTIGALEQIGERFQDFLSYIVDQRPQVCVHVEPLFELYDSDEPFDALAMKHHSARGYLKGYVPEIRRRAAAGEIQIELEMRCRVGGLFHENSVIVWRPI